MPRRKGPVLVVESVHPKRLVQPQDLPRGWTEQVRHDDPAGVVDGHESAVEGGVDLRGKQQAVEQVQAFGIGAPPKA
ncbi:MAG TPA: hypothetical protein VLR48_15540 [Thiocapsa sp.]|nr:hypothetical protein [Thiocapsa sp.]HSO84011.1 hypothetical protein [Thiocapsa sp.]